MRKLFYYCQRIWRGRSITRIMMNDALADLAISGRVIDVGGARRPDYYNYFKKNGEVTIESIDGMTHDINFESDQLPFAVATADTVVLCNVLEHIYHHQHLLLETNRILKPGGQFIGFVPFFIQYHPDPHDYFRYTKEALARMMTEASFDEVVVRPVGLGPLMANFNSIMLYLPVFFRVVLFPWYWLLSIVLVKMRPELVDKFPLGLVFIGKKKI